MSRTNFQNDAIFWVEVDKISPNPYQPRKEFTESGLKDLAESIRMYGILQPLTVTRTEVPTNDGLSVAYELIAGERRLRASKLAGLLQVPVIIRSGPEDDRVKLELAIIENLQREDLNPIDRALAFKQLNEQFEFTHSQIAKKVGKSREYVSNSIRLLQLPDDIQQAIVAGKISEGHARPLGMLRDKPDEQANIFREVVLKKLTVRETEQIARGIAKDKVRKKTTKLEPEMQRMQRELSETLGTRVHIEPREVGGKLVIDYFSASDVEHLLDLVNASLLNTRPGQQAAMDKFAANLQQQLEKSDDNSNSLDPIRESSGNQKVEVPADLPVVDSSPDTAMNPEDKDPFSYLQSGQSESVSHSESQQSSPVEKSSTTSTGTDEFGLDTFSL